MMRKAAGAWHLLRTRGLSGFFKRIQWYFQRWWLSDNWLLGKLVELRGDRVRLDGCQFDLSSGNILTAQKAGFWVGNYEVKERIAVQQIPNLGLPIVELGGGIGVVSCVTSKHFANPANHVVVEANPNMIPVITRQRDLNGCRFTILPANLAYDGFEVPFHVSSKFLASSALDLPDQETEVVRVPATTLGAILDRHGFDRIVLICDIEGAEVSLFDHESDLLGKRVQYLVLEY
ncbi:MAG: FkbM family methyltransferase, partial [Anaerolineae bacterium]|nr:FkbM family methyltransferase [Anaerolineae bacterium]